MLRIGLTGGIASGKTAVATLFARHGAAIVDTDAVAREVVEPGTPGLAAVVREFGTGVLDAEGRLDRGAMRRRIFDDADARRRLESILHPLIRARTVELMESADGPYVVAVVPLLVETGFAALVDRVAVVDCPEAQQVGRLMRRDGVTESAALGALAAQAERAARLDVADDVIDNSGDPDALADQVAALDARYRRLARNCPPNEGRAE